MDWSLTATSTDSNTIDDVSLLPFEAELACLVGSSGMVALVDDGELSIFPRADSEEESHHV